MTFQSHRIGTVAVLGGSVAGLLAAAAVSPHAVRVVVIDRDELPEEPGPRPGTPQVRHTHGLLASGRAAIELLLPGTTEDLEAQGAVASGDMGSSGRWYIGGGLITDSEVGAQGLAVSRPLLEAYLRVRVRDLPNVTVLDRTDVLGFRSDHARVANAVRLRDLTDEAAQEEILPADLVIDATGRPGRATRWFAEHGWPVPPEDKVVVGVRYATTHLRHDPADVDGRAGVISGATPEVPRAAAAIRQEDGTWILTLAGYAEQGPPLEPDGFRAFAHTVVAPEIGDLVDAHELIGGIAHYRFPHCVRRRIKDVRLPERYAVIGDAICSFDPTFGQGMSVAALEAVALGHCLEALRPGRLEVALATYHGRADEYVDAAWTLVVGAAVDIVRLTEERPRGHTLVSAYVRAVQRAARDDREVALALMRVVNLLAPPQTLFRPAIARRVARATVGRQLVRVPQHQRKAPVPA